MQRFQSPARNLKILRDSGGLYKEAPIRLEKIPFTKWILGTGFFLGGWVLLFLVHLIEGNHPAFFHAYTSLFRSPIWVAKEAWMFLTGTHRRPTSEGTPQSDAMK